MGVGVGSGVATGVGTGVGSVEGTGVAIGLGSGVGPASNLAIQSEALWGRSEVTAISKPRLLITSSILPIRSSGGVTSQAAFLYFAVIS